MRKIPLASTYSQAATGSGGAIVPANPMQTTVSRPLSPTHIISLSPEGPSGTGVTPLSGHQPLSSTSNPASAKHRPSIYVNFNLNGNIEQERLSRLLKQVNELRALKERNDKFYSKESLEADIEANMDEMQLQSKIQRSKRLLFKYRVYDFLRRPTGIWSKLYHFGAFTLVLACLVISIYPNIGRFFGKLPVLEILEKSVLIWYTAEYVLR